MNPKLLGFEVDDTCSPVEYEIPVELYTEASYDFACECGGSVWGTIVSLHRRTVLKASGCPCDSCRRTYTVEVVVV